MTMQLVILQALRYAEFLARIISSSPHLFPASMARSLYHLADKLRYCEPQRAVSEESGSPEWMQHLASVTQAMEVSNFYSFDSEKPKLMFY